MSVELDKLARQIEAYLGKQKWIVFRSRARWNADSDFVVWDEESRPDYREFLKVAEELGVKVLVYHERKLDKATLEEMDQDIDELPLSAPELRDIGSRVSALYDHVGETLAIELSFDMAGTVYLYRQQSPIMTQLLDLLDEIEIASGPFGPGADYAGQEDDEEDDEEPPQRYFSKN